MQLLRAELEDDLLRIPHVDFVSIGFLEESPVMHILVSLGSRRVDLVQILLPDIVQVIFARAAGISIAPEIQILCGKARSENVLTPA